MLSIVDLVLNHASFDAEWVHENPEVTYNLQNTPHLQLAYLLDVQLQRFSTDFAEGKYA